MNIITLNCDPIQGSADLHQQLAQTLSLPRYYGNNLDAMYDCLTELGQDTELVLNHWYPLSVRLGHYAEKTLYAFHCAVQDNPHLTVTIHP